MRCSSDPSLTAALLLIEKLTDLVQIQTEAVKNLPVEKIVVWDSGGDGGLSDLGRKFMGVLPPIHELAKIAGLELPEFLGRVTPKEERTQPAPPNPHGTPGKTDSSA